jgi:hypothetical protein
MEVPVYLHEMVIKLTLAEALQVLAIDLDGNAEQALSFLHEKIVEKLPNSSSRPLSNQAWQTMPCVPGCKNPHRPPDYHLPAEP